MTHPRHPFLLTFFTNDPRMARAANDAGVDRIGLDLEALYKEERQGQLNTWISDHRESELPAVRDMVTKQKLFVRTNPPHPGLQEEIERYIAAGADVLMLPFFKQVDDAARFVDCIAGRAEVSLLIETAASAVRIERILALEGIHDVHVGLNDLHLSLGLASHFELLLSPFMEWLSAVLRDSGKHWGFGGIGRHMDDRLPIPSDLVYAQYARLGARSALVSRVFTSPDPYAIDMTAEVASARERMDYWFEAGAAEIAAARNQLREIAETRGLFRPRPVKHAAEPAPSPS